MIPEILGAVDGEMAVPYRIRRFRPRLLLGVALVYTELAAVNASVPVVVSTKYNLFTIRNRRSSSLKLVVLDVAQRYTIEFLASRPDLLL